MDQNPPPPGGMQPPPPPGGMQPPPPPGGMQPPPPPGGFQPPPPPGGMQPPPPPGGFQPPPQGYAPQPGYAPPGGYPTTSGAKNPILMLLVSAVIPGLGTILNGETGKGVGIMVGFVVSCILFIALIGFLLAPAVWGFGLYDAFQGAKKWNVRNGFPPGA